MLARACMRAANDHHPVPACEGLVLCRRWRPEALLTCRPPSAGRTSSLDTADMEPAGSEASECCPHKLYVARQPAGAPREGILSHIGWKKPMLSYRALRASSRPARTTSSSCAQGVSFALL